ncbi:MAG: aminoacyl-tRNA deacylase [Deltaproteobacteria bacterium]|nr:aminoacyl-tRNA deacylase [Deltaproteobacteria bacterium]
MARKSLPKPPAAVVLDRLGLAYELVSYDPGPLLSAEETALILGRPPETVFKTLLVRGDVTGPLEVCLPAGREAELKTLAKATGNKKISLSSVRELTELTGFQRGGCSPLGGRKSFPVWLDQSILSLDRVLINAGRRGQMLILDPRDLQKAARASLADLVRPEHLPG